MTLLSCLSLLSWWLGFGSKDGSPAGFDILTGNEVVESDLTYRRRLSVAASLQTTTARLLAHFRNLGIAISGGVPTVPRLNSPLIMIDQEYLTIA
jgi:hypothetical protein